LRIRLERVQYMPEVLEPGVLYFAEEFGAATHLCPCGCGHKVQTPVGPSDYSLRVNKSGPTLSPSVGNWQRPCQSHYWIRNGQIVWSEPWTSEEIAAGRALESARDRAYFATRVQAHNTPWARFVRWIKRVLSVGS
jgi:hypothetical protein